VNFDALPILAGTVDKMRALAEEKGIELSVDVSGSLPAVRANPDRLEQVITNLVENALRFTPPGGKVVVNVYRDGAFACVKVADSGPGIPQDQQDLIWEKFYKVDKSRVRNNVGGTGLGLATVKRLVENMGGGVSVESTPGQGATFIFTLKLQK